MSREGSRNQITQMVPLPSDWQGGPKPDRLIHAVLAAGALVAQADGQVDPVERWEILIYARCSGLRPLRRSASEIFDQLVRDIGHAQPHGERAVEDLLKCVANSHAAWIVLWGAEHVATADQRIEKVELAAIDSVRKTLGLPPGILAMSGLDDLA